MLIYIVIALALYVVISWAFGIYFLIECNHNIDDYLDVVWFMPIILIFLPFAFLAGFLAGFAIRFKEKYYLFRNSFKK